MVRNNKPLIKGGDDKGNVVLYKKYLLKRQIIEIFYKQGIKTIPEISDITNNSVPNITNIIGELANEGWVKDYGTGQSKSGRKPTLYGITTDKMFIVGIDLGRKYTRMCIFNLHNQHVGELLEFNEGLSNSDDVLLFLKLSFNKLLQNNKLKTDQILGVGIAIPGLIDIRKGVSCSFPQLGEKPLNEIFEKLFGCNVYVEHDTRAMALAEKWFGLAKTASDVLFLNIGSGLGLSMILNGELYRGHSGFSGEFGHIQIDPDGELCYCEKIGCLETIASGTAMVKQAKEVISKGKNSIILKLTDNNLEKIKLKTIIEAAKLGDQFAIELIEQTSEHLAKGISILIHLYNPETIVIGGEMAEAEDLIKELIKQKLSKYTIRLLKQDTEIVVSNLKNEAVLLGTIPGVMSCSFFG